MRTTLTLDDDIAAKLAVAGRKNGTSFKEAVNTALRRGLLGAAVPQKSRSFRVQPQKMGALKPGVSLDCISALTDDVDGGWR